MPLGGDSTMSEWIGTMRDAMGERELLYTMNGKPVYRDEMRPIGESTPIPWKELWYTFCATIGAVFAVWRGWNA
jgi:hypothetical protein